MFLRLIFMSLLWLSAGIAHAGDSWLVSIYSAAGDRYGTVVKIGGFAMANDGIDRLYDTALFAENPSINVYFDHPEWGRADEKFWSDIKSLGYIKRWYLTVSSTQIGQQVQLAWDLSQLPSHYRIELRDQFNGQYVNLRAAPAYAFLNEKSVAHIIEITVTDTRAAPPRQSNERDSVETRSAVVARAPLIVEGQSTIVVVAIGSVDDDHDNDGVSDDDDQCPGEDASGFDDNNDGCIDDSDGDGILDNRDMCNDQDATGFDLDNDGCIDDIDNDGILDSIDQCALVYGGEFDADEDGCPDDSDGDGLTDDVDSCPQQNASGYDIDGDGCIDDTDMDGVLDNRDKCSNENAAGYDRNFDGCIDDSDGDRIKDDVDLCPEENAKDRDADHDGCVDTLVGLEILVETLVSLAELDERSANELLVYVRDADKMARRDKFCGSIGRLVGFDKRLAMVGKGKKKIAANISKRLRSYNDNVILELRQQLKAVERSCE